MISVKTHLRHFHITDKIYGEVNGCNWKVRENQLGFSCIAEIFLDFLFSF